MCSEPYRATLCNRRNIMEFMLGPKISLSVHTARERHCDKTFFWMASAAYYTVFYMSREESIAM